MYSKTIPEPEAEETNGESLLEEIIDGYFKDEAVAESLADEPKSVEAAPGGMRTMDSTTMSDETEQPAGLPSEPTDHPLYQDVENFINQGKWQAAQAPLKELLSLYPDDTYLKQVAASVQTRSALLESVEEIAPARRPILARSMRFIIPVAVVIALLALVTVVLLVLQRQVLPQVTEQRQRARISQIRQDAQAALASGDYDRAIRDYTELLELLPDDPEAKDGLERASQLRATVSLYSDAIAEIEAQRWENALSLLQQIQTEQPGYRDVAVRIAFVQEQQDLSGRFAQAEAAFERGYYELAVEEYEALQAMDYGFQRETVQDHLFLSYLQLGLAEEAAAGSDPQQLQAALDKLEKALALRPDDAQARGESQLVRLYLVGLDEIEAGDWSRAVGDLTPVYEARPDFAAGSVAQRLYEARVALGDELLADERYDEALAMYQEARLVTGVDAAGLDQKIAKARQMLATPTPTPEPAPTPTEPGAESQPQASPARGGAPAPRPTATPRPLPYSLKSMSVRPNCDGFGYIHGVVWSAYNLPMAGVTVQAFNTTTGFGPLVSLPTNTDGIYQIILQKDQIDGMWAVQVLENGQPASQAWGQALGGGCVNGAQELKVDWQRAPEIQ